MGNKPRVVATIDLPAEGRLVTLDAQESHHIIDVLRLKNGDEVEVFVSSLGISFDGIIKTEKPLTKIIITKELKSKLPTIRVHLIVALIKSSLCELIVEKCTELGLHSVCFFQAEFHREGANYEEFKKRFLRLNKIRDSAIKQSRTSVVTELRLTKDLGSALTEHFSQTGLYLSLEQCPSIIELLTSTKATLEKINKIDDLYLIIGPEAGLSESEIKLANNRGATGVSLGKNILRTETACIVSSGVAMSFAW